MIYVVEIPRDGRPLAWFAFDTADLGRKACKGREQDGRVVFAKQSPLEMLAAYGLTPDTPNVAASYPQIVELAQRHGWETPLYRADYLLDGELWQAEPIAELDAYVAAIADGRVECRVYLSDRAAESALYGDPLYQGRDGFYAHMALREQLIAMEVIADDL